MAISSIVANGLNKFPVSLEIRFHAPISWGAGALCPHYVNCQTILSEEAIMPESCLDANGDTWTIYTDRVGEWRWKRVARNGQTVGASSEGYKNKQDCIANARRNGMTCNPS